VHPTPLEIVLNIPPLTRSSYRGLAFKDQWDTERKACHQPWHGHDKQVFSLWRQQTILRRSRVSRMPFFQYL